MLFSIVRLLWYNSGAPFKRESSRFRAHLWSAIHPFLFEIIYLRSVARSRDSCFGDWITSRGVTVVYHRLLQQDETKSAIFGHAVFIFHAARRGP
jgi:hypothetical protein